MNNRFRKALLVSACKEEADKNDAKSIYNHICYKIPPTDKLISIIIENF